MLQCLGLFFDQAADEEGRLNSILGSSRGGSASGSVGSRSVRASPPVSPFATPQKGSGDDEGSDVEAARNRMAALARAQMGAPGHVQAAADAPSDAESGAGCN